MYKNKYFFQAGFFSLTLFVSHFVTLLFYDSSKGLDFGKYKKNLQFFSGDNVEILDSNGSLYFYLVSKSGNLNLFDSGFEQNIILNSMIQTTNFFLYVVGVIGLIILFHNKSYKLGDIFLALSILNFFPPALYFRLTMKPEMLAFTLLPWVIYLFDLYVKSNKNSFFIFGCTLLSVLLTLKASIMGMVLVSLLIIYFKDLKIFPNKLKMVLITSTFSSFIIFFNWFVTGGWLFSKPAETSLENIDKWNYVADINFFTNIDLTNLVENPFKYIHSDSFISITLLDTFSDYFHFFWNHKENSNYIAFNKIKFTDNFLIQEYSAQYISIILTAFMYLLFILFALKKIKNFEYLLLPFTGWFILILNSQGFPSRNFDPTTGDLFKVHYYSFLITVSFFVLLLIIYKYFSFTKSLSLFLIPVFLFVIGFPKTLDEESLIELEFKCLQSQFCHSISIDLLRNF